MQEEFDSMCNALAKAHAEFTENAIKEALIEKFGEIPPTEILTKHCKCCIEDTTGVHHYVWFAEPPQIGDHIDTGEILCSIAPPKFHTYEN